MAPLNAGSVAGNLASGKVPDDKFEAFNEVKLAPLNAGSVAGNLASGKVPDDKFEAFNEVKLAPEPLNPVAVTVPETSKAVAGVLVPIPKRELLLSQCKLELEDNVSESVQNDSLFAAPVPSTVPVPPPPPPAVVWVVPSAKRMAGVQSLPSLSKYAFSTGLPPTTPLIILSNFAPEFVMGLLVPMLIPTAFAPSTV